MQNNTYTQRSYEEQTAGAVYIKSTHTKYTWKCYSTRLVTGRYHPTDAPWMRRKKSILIYTPPSLSLMLEGLGRRDATCDHFHFCILSHLYFRCGFWGNTLPFCTRFHPFCRKYCKSPKWKPLNSSSLRLTRIDVIASLGLPWKHGAPKNSNTLIQPALGLAWRGWLFVSIHNPSSDSKQ